MIRPSRGQVPSTRTRARQAGPGTYRDRGAQRSLDLLRHAGGSDRIGITLANLSILKTGKGRAVRFSTLEAICAALQCQPGDLLEYAASGDADSAPPPASARPQLKRRLKTMEQEG